MTDDQINQIEGRLRKLEDRSAIAELTARYALAVDQAWPAKTVNLAALSENLHFGRRLGKPCEGSSRPEFAGHP
ncbi:hypothetical protein GC209_07940 [bacterium]|nr:hypothetical protein [bacterium]